MVVKKIVDNFGKLSKKCLELENNVSCLQEGLKTLKNEQSESFKIVGEKIVNIEDASANQGEKIDKLESDLKKINDHLGAVGAVGNSGISADGRMAVTSDLVNEVTVQIQSKKDRENNIVIFGVIESEDENNDVRKDFDFIEVAKIASICDVSLEKEDVSKLFSLGRRTPNKKRLMLVSFVSLETKRKIMRNLPKLRDQNLSIVVDHDMTPEERRLNRELYLEAKRQEEADLSGTGFIA